MIMFRPARTMTNDEEAFIDSEPTNGAADVIARESDPRCAFIVFAG